jgi:hypothetical protein
LQPQTYDLEDVEVLDTRSKKVEQKQVVKLLKGEVVALAVYSQKPDPLHLRVIKDGTLVFVLPSPKGMPGFPGIPVPPGGVGVGGGTIGVGTVTPATPAPPVPPTIPGPPSPPTPAPK